MCILMIKWFSDKVQATVNKLGVHSRHVIRCFLLHYAVFCLANVNINTLPAFFTVYGIGHGVSLRNIDTGESYRSSRLTPLGKYGFSIQYKVSLVSLQLHRTCKHERCVYKNANINLVLWRQKRRKHTSTSAHYQTYIISAMGHPVPI